jgi:hypothetical protein
VKWDCLTTLLTPEQREQFAAILLARIKIGWGSIEIVVKDGHIKEYRDTRTYPAVKPEEEEKGN